jgi:hypothetical protein
VLEACERALERDRGCGETVIAPRCDEASWALLPEVHLVYDCVAETACSGPVDDCFATVPIDDFGTQVCAALDESCSPYHCSGTAAEANKRAPFATDAVRAAGMACVKEIDAKTSRRATKVGGGRRSHASTRGTSRVDASAPRRSRRSNTFSQHRACSRGNISALCGRGPAGSAPSAASRAPVSLIAASHQ